MKISVTGDDELVGRLQALDKAGSRIAKKALEIAVQPILDKAKQRVRPTSPTIADSIGVQQKVKNKGLYRFIRIGPTTDPGNKTVKAKLNPITGLYKARWHNPAKTAHLVELGTKPHKIRLFGKVQIDHPGAAARPYLVPALEEHATMATAVFQQEAWQRIGLLMRKRARRAARIQKKADALLAQGGDL